MVLPNPGRIAAPPSITVGTPITTSFATLAVSWSAVGSAYLAGYEVEFLPASVAVWQGYGAGFGATAASVPTAEPTGFRARAVARSGAVSGWREALVAAAVSAPTATGITGGVRPRGSVTAAARRHGGDPAGLCSTVLRYFNASGADSDAEIDEQRDLETHLIPRAMMALLGRLPDFAVFGADYATPDGTAIRDYVHVADLADAHVAALDVLCAGDRGGIYNLGSAEGHSVREVLRAIEATTGRRLPAATGARRPGDPPMLVADASLARRALGFVPKRSNLAQTTSTAWAWHLHTHAASASGPRC